MALPVPVIIWASRMAQTLGASDWTPRGMTKIASATRASAALASDTFSFFLVPAGRLGPVRQADISATIGLPLRSNESTWVIRFAHAESAAVAVTRATSTVGKE